MMGGDYCPESNMETLKRVGVCVFNVIRVIGEILLIKIAFIVCYILAFMVGLILLHASGRLPLMFEHVDVRDQQSGETLCSGPRDHCSSIIESRSGLSTIVVEELHMKWITFECNETNYNMDSSCNMDIVRARHLNYLIWFHFTALVQMMRLDNTSQICLSVLIVSCTTLFAAAVRHTNTPYNK